MPNPHIGNSQGRVSQGLESRIGHWKSHFGNKKNLRDPRSTSPFSWVRNLRLSVVMDTAWGHTTGFRCSDTEVGGFGHAEVPWKERDFSRDRMCIMVLRGTHPIAQAEIFTPVTWRYLSSETSWIPV